MPQWFSSLMAPGYLSVQPQGKVPSSSHFGWFFAVSGFLVDETLILFVVLWIEMRRMPAWLGARPAVATSVAISARRNGPEGCRSLAPLSRTRLSLPLLLKPRTLD